MEYSSDLSYHDLPSASAGHVLMILASDLKIHPSASEAEVPLDAPMEGEQGGLCQRVCCHEEKPVLKFSYSTKTQVIQDILTTNLNIHTPSISISLPSHDTRCNKTRKRYDSNYDCEQS